MKHIPQVTQLTTLFPSITANSSNTQIPSRSLICAKAALLCVRSHNLRSSIHAPIGQLTSGRGRAEIKAKPNIHQIETPKKVLSHAVPWTSSSSASPLPPPHCKKEQHSSSVVISFGIKILEALVIFRFDLKQIKIFIEFEQLNVRCMFHRAQFTRCTALLGRSIGVITF